MTLPGFLRSRKFWSLIVGALVIVLRSYVPAFPIPDDQVASIILLLVAYILGTGLEDAGNGIAQAQARARPK